MLKWPCGTVSFRAAAATPLTNSGGQVLKDRRVEPLVSPGLPHTVDWLRELVDLYESWNKPDEAEKWRSKLPRAEHGGE